jgi:hypothetical protein
VAGRSGSTFSKRQKERARQEKQREKAEKKRQRKLESKNRPPGFEIEDMGTFEDGFGFEGSEMADDIAGDDESTGGNGASSAKPDEVG